jgi:frataxin
LGSLKYKAKEINQFMNIHKQLFSNSSSDEWSTNSTSFANVNDFHVEADRTIDVVLNECEKIVDLLDDDNNEFDYKYAEGVINIEFGSSIGTFVLNKQTPNRQLWLSSPISGPNRYDFDHAAQQWQSNRDQHSLQELLETEFTDIVKNDFTFDEDF